MIDDDSPQKRIPNPGPARRLVTPISFSQLADGKAELVIEHEGQLYRLRATKNGKLLLNK